ncbi:MAG: hypothetical protein ABSG27_08605 [Candidatus Acidiferrales bacterium]|jgi:hypothetical protein
MPFIRGRYHMNPVMGEALEAAREAESALLALEQQAHADDNSSDGSRDDDASSAGADSPVHRVEIEAAEVVPPSSGRAQRGFVARVHRLAANPPSTGDQQSPSGAHPWRYLGHPAIAPAPETHVFSDHRDLVNFLRDLLGREAAAKS